MESRWEFNISTVSFHNAKFHSSLLHSSLTQIYISHNRNSVELCLLALLYSSWSFSVLSHFTITILYCCFKPLLQLILPLLSYTNNTYNVFLYPFSSNFSTVIIICALDRSMQDNVLISQSSHPALKTNKYSKSQYLLLMLHHDAMSELYSTINTLQMWFQILILIVTFVGPHLLFLPIFTLMQLIFLSRLVNIDSSSLK